MRVNIMDQIEVRLEPQSSGFTTGRPAGRGELRGGLALPGAFDPVSLLFAVDAFPPATFDIDIWDATGCLVAQGTLLAAIPLG